MSGYVSRDFNCLHFLLAMCSLLAVSLCQPYQLPHRCSNRLENALEHMRRRSVQTKSSSASRAMWEPPPQSPYQLYHSFYGQHSDPEDDFYNVGAYSSGRGYHAKLLHRNGQANPFSDSSSALELEDLLAVNQQSQHHRQPHKLTISRVDVEDLKVRVPPAKSANRWVEIDKCKFSTENSTLDTRLIFPDLTLSGKVVMQPMGRKSRRLGAASVRTDSHFAEPGFISVFAHGCQGPTGIRLRQNSKRRFGSAPEVELGEPHVILGSKRPQSWGKYHQQAGYDIRQVQVPQRSKEYSLELGSDSQDQDSGEFIDVNGDNFYRRQFSKKRRRRRRYAKENFEDQVNFSEDVLHFEDEQLQQLVEPDARAFADIFSGSGSSPSGDREELVGEAMSHELEKLFSMGVRGLLTTYMQRALQPAIKETLMENMGYTLSYG
ncbi:GM23465 [Drosophila sechellia]|uniref:GM23465 n=1 Tax=Drosophila sechellia TaxID=7238 RepID=B4HH67_DROSE|nr:GM23465 [Drosophila sechellia]